MHTGRMELEVGTEVGTGGSGRREVPQNTDTYQEQAPWKALQTAKSPVSDKSFANQQANLKLIPHFIGCQCRVDET